MEAKPSLTRNYKILKIEVCFQVFHLGKNSFPIFLHELQKYKNQIFFTSSLLRKIFKKFQSRITKKYTFDYKMKSELRFKFYIKFIVQMFTLIHEFWPKKMRCRFAPPREVYFSKITMGIFSKIFWPDWVYPHPPISYPWFLPRITISILKLDTSKIKPDSYFSISNSNSTFKNLFEKNEIWS